MDKTLLHLLIVGELAEDGEMIARIFRDSRYLLKSQRTADRASLTAALAKGGWDALVSCNNVSHLRPETVLDVLQKAGQDLPFVVFSARVTPVDMVRFLEHGIHDVVPLEHPERLPAVLGREILSAQARARCRISERLCHETEHKLDALSATIRDAFCYSQDGMHIETNQAYRTLFGFEDPGALEGVPVLNLVQGSDQGRVKDYFKRAAKGEVRAQEFTAVRADGSTFTAEMRIQNLQVRGEACQQIVVHERTAPQVAETAPAAGSDRTRFLAALATAAPGMALLYFDVDDLAAFNTAQGNAAGDAVLAGLEQMLSGIKDGQCGRVSGDELAVLVPVAEAQAQTLLKAVCTRAQAEHRVALSGYVAYRVRDEAEVAWLERARAGTVRAPIAPPAPAPAVLADDWTPIALDPSQLVVLYQPLVPLHGDAVEQYEVILQQKGQTRLDTARVPAETDQLVLGRVLAQARALHQNGHEVRFFLKPGLAFIRDRAQANQLTQALEGLSPATLAFSVEERLLTLYPDEVLAFARALKRQEFLVALEAAGTGAGSARFLSQKMVDFVKLDDGLARNLHADSLNYFLLQQAVALGRHAGYKTIIKSVDTADVVSMLWQCEVDYVEGSYFQEPHTEPHYDFGGEVVSTDVGTAWHSS